MYFQIFFLWPRFIQMMQFGRELRELKFQDKQIRINHVEVGRAFGRDKNIITVSRNPRARAQELHKNIAAALNNDKTTGRVVRFRCRYWFSAKFNAYGKISIKYAGSEEK